MDDQERPWYFEAYDPRQSFKWIPMWRIEEHEIDSAVELRNELNRINAPALLRIVREPDDEIQ